MKKLLLFVFVLAAVFFALDSQYNFTAVSAQSDVTNITARQESDPQLATFIRRLTDRSTDGLAQSRSVNGTRTLDLGEGFQNVMLSKIDSHGEPIAACVTSIGEANAFLGRNLDTGEPIAANPFKRDAETDVAARHGMSPDEFAFYKKLIEDAALQRAASPNAATLNIVNLDGAGEGFNDPTVVTPEGSNTGTTRGEQRTNLFNFAAGIWGAFLDSSVPININSEFNPLTPCSTSGGVLGSAGTINIHSDFPNAQFPGTWYHAALANKLSGVDQSAGSSEMRARFNTDVDNGCLGAGTRFYYGLDNSTPSGRINLLIVLLHEMGHGLGFSNFVNGTTGALNNGLPDIYTRYMLDRTTNKYWYQMTNAERQASSLNTGNVLWDGENVKIASGSLTSGRDTAGRVQLFTPNPFQQGSSLSHFDTAVSPNVLMEPAINLGLSLSLDLTRQQMRDIGWYRDTTADLVPDTITNVQTGGSALVIGNQATVRWTNTGGFNRNVTIELSTDGGATFPTTLASNIANTGSFTFTVPNSPTTQARIRVREFNFINPVGVSAANFAIGNTAPTTRKLFDFDGDGKADISVFRPANGTWYLQNSSTGFAAAQFGASADKHVAADYDGDGKADIAVYRAGNWYLQRSQTGFAGVAFGLADDIPVPADFDGDGKADVAVFRPSTGSWYVQQSTAGYTGIQFGRSGDKPIAADFDGDNKADFAVFRPTDGTWYVLQSRDGFRALQFGIASDKPVAADYDGDNKADFAVYRDGAWYLQRSSTGFAAVQFGIASDTPAPADFDGDGKTDFAVFRSGNWYLQQSTAGFAAYQFGASGDRPAPSNLF